MSLRGTLWVGDKKAWRACLPARRANVSKEKIIDPFSPKSGVLKKVRIRPGEIRVQSVYEIKNQGGKPDTWKLCTPAARLKQAGVS